MARLKVGTVEYLKNFRRGLQHQLKRCKQELAEARVARDVEQIEACTERCCWVQRKQSLLDDKHEMVWDKPSMENGREKEFSLAS